MTSSWSHRSCTWWAVYLGHSASQIRVQSQWHWLFTKWSAVSNYSWSHVNKCLLLAFPFLSAVTMWGKEIGFPVTVDIYMAGRELVKENLCFVLTCASSLQGTFIVFMGLWIFSSLPCDSTGCVSIQSLSTSTMTWKEVESHMIVYTRQYSVFLFLLSSRKEMEGKVSICNWGGQHLKWQSSYALRPHAQWVFAQLP